MGGASIVVIGFAVAAREPKAGEANDGVRGASVFLRVALYVTVEARSLSDEAQSCSDEAQSLSDEAQSLLLC